MMIEQSQIDAFHQDGYLVVDNVLNEEEIRGLQTDLAQWVEESRKYDRPYGLTIDGRPRFDIENDHSSTHPSLRRISSPTEISANYARIALQSRMTEIAGQLIGGNGIRFHHSKVNAKLPHTATQVKWHQDFPFTPHTNADLITALLMLGPVTMENGPLNVIPGSHQSEQLYNHWQDGKFTGAIPDNEIAAVNKVPVSCTGFTGTVCFMHTRLLHSSSPNNTDLPRNLFITVYAAEDALSLADNPLPSKHEGTLVYGKESGLVRCTNNIFKLPQKPKGASFFVQQAGQDEAVTY